MINFTRERVIRIIEEARKKNLPPNLRGANLCNLDLRFIDLKRAILGEASFEHTNLFGANLARCDLYKADLTGAILTRATLALADLQCANLRNTDLRNADLRWARLEDANLNGAKLPHFQICPEEGGFYAWKKTTKGVIKIYIPEDAKRISCLAERKCRASHVTVIDGEGIDGASPNAPFGKEVIYEKGATIYADKFDNNIKLECTHGIHFFMTKQEAEEWIVLYYNFK